MAAYLDGAIRSALGAWAVRMRKELNLPLAVRWREEGEDWVNLGEHEPPRLRVDIVDAKGAAAMLSPSLDSLGEAYVEGHINVEGSVSEVLEMAHALSRGNPQGANGREPVQDEELQFVGRSSWLQRMMSKVTELGRHTRHTDEQAIQYHYDVSNDFYARWLDPAMVYSCAYFETGEETLVEAQTQKIDHILNKLRLAPGHTLLDIGCGWGALLIRAAQRFDIRGVGVTLSQNQYELARERVAQAGLADRVDIRLQDYRDIPGQFDRISSVGMFEHVGLKNLVPYFRRIHDLLTPGGWALNHGITSSDAFNRETSYGGGRFIDKYVFPDGELPHMHRADRHAAGRAGGHRRGEPAPPLRPHAEPVERGLRGADGRAARHGDRAHLAHLARVPGRLCLGVRARRNLAVPGAVPPRRRIGPGLALVTQMDVCMSCR